MSLVREQERYFKDDDRPVIPLLDSYADGFFVEPHHHRRHQLLYAASGTVIISTPHDTWVMPALRGMWIPGGVTHDVRILGAVTMQSLYIEPALIKEMPCHCQVLGIPPFMRGLIAEAVRLPELPEFLTGRAAALMTLIQHEIRLLPRLPLSLPLPRHEAMAERCRSFLKFPDAHQTIGDWSCFLGMSRRSFTRVFKHETGLSFVQWRQQACIVSALPRLVAGEAVTSVAIDLGYDNPAAFTAMFRRVLGSPPRSYLGSGF